MVKRRRILLAGALTTLVLAVMLWKGLRPAHPVLPGVADQPPVASSAFGGEMPASQRPTALHPLEPAVLAPGRKMDSTPVPSPTTDTPTSRVTRTLLALGRAQAEHGAPPGAPVPSTAAAAAGTPEEQRASLEPGEVRAAIREVLPAVKHCYERGLEMKTDSQGKTVISFTLVAADGGGWIEEAEIVDSELGNPTVDACVLDAVASARFPMPHGEGTVHVTYPFRFQR